MFMIVRGLEGDSDRLTVGSIALPPIVPWQLRLRKFTTHLNHVQPLEFVDFVNYTSATAGEDSGGASGSDGEYADGDAPADGAGPAAPARGRVRGPGRGPVDQGPDAAVWG